MAKSGVLASDLPKCISMNTCSINRYYLSTNIVKGIICLHVFVFSCCVAVICLSIYPCFCVFICVCVCQVIVHEVPGQELEVEVFDKDPDQDDFLGR